ncbi:MAG TPA: NAD-dependent epimerase/dehydratase family protein [Acidimicrobiia bacterium]|nr:NAD-dependent epimerase/dehydratase family protein [Acidimicrobiia bacterium]
MNVVVTGGAGFIGANLSRRLVERGDAVVVVDDLSTGDRDNLRDLDVTFVEGTILDAATLDTAMRDASAVVHLAARPSVPRSISDPVASHLANASGTVEVLEAARRAGNLHVIVASSSSVYGANPTLPKREDLATLPLSPYAASKLATESYALAYQQSFGLPALAFRFFNVFGPLQAAGHAYAAVVPAFVSAALEQRPLTVHGDGKQSRDFTYVDTVTEVIADALTRRVTSAGPVNLAFGTRTDLLSLIAELEAVLGTRVDVEHTETRAGDVKHSQADSTRLQELFPDVVPTALPDALRATVDWFRAQ